MRTTFHKDGTMTYWSVYSQTWRRSYGISNDDLRAMSPQMQAKVSAHMVRHIRQMEAAKNGH